MLEILQDFPSADIPLHRLLEVCPLMRPRLFSLSSSQSLSPHSASITAALVRYTTPYKRTKTGLCSAHLAGMTPEKACPQGGVVADVHTAAAGERAEDMAVDGTASAVSVATDMDDGVGFDHEKQSRTASSAQDVHSAAATGLGDGVAFEQGSHVAVWVERGVLRMPKDRSTPIILIGPGTGTRFGKRKRQFLFPCVLSETFRTDSSLHRMTTNGTALVDTHSAFRV